MADRRTVCTMVAAGIAVIGAAPGPAHAAAKGVLRIARRYVEDFLGKADTKVADAVLDPNITVVTGLSPQGPIVGRETYKKIFLEFHAAFPGTAPLAIVDAFEAGERAVVRFQYPTRHAKDYFGVAATGRAILFDETHVMRIRRGLVVENVVSATNLEFEMLMAPVLTPMILK